MAVYSNKWKLIVGRGNRIVCSSNSRSYVAHLKYLNARTCSGNILNAKNFDLGTISHINLDCKS
jgi:hypothetical protein